MRRRWRVLGLIALWHLTLGAPNCEGTSGGARFPTLTCGGATCSDRQFCDAAQRCVWRPQVGQHCEAGQCMPGALCDIGLSRARCVPEGEVGTGGECSALADCADGLVCHGDLRCGAPSPAGTECVSYRPTCQAAHTCREAADEVDRCQALSQEGEHCGWRGHCVDGLTCSQLTGVWACMVPRALGEGCQIHLDCEEGLRCIEVDDVHQCAYGRTLGEPCDVAAQAFCEGELQCDAGTCRLSQLDEPCVIRADCVEGLACSADDVCITPRAAGEACAYGECAEGLECVGRGTPAARCE